LRYFHAGLGTIAPPALLLAGQLAGWVRFGPLERVYLAAQRNGMGHPPEGFGHSRNPIWLIHGVRDEDIAVEVYELHFFLDRKPTVFFCSTVLNALKETVSPDFVLNFTRVGFATVLVALNVTMVEAISNSTMRKRVSGAMPCWASCFVLYDRGGWWLECTRGN